MISWFCIFKYLRRFGPVRVYIKLVIDSLGSMVNFFTIFAVVSASFISAMRVKAVYNKKLQPAHAGGSEGN
jgi:hypothetical protein